MLTCFYDCKEKREYPNDELSEPMRTLTRVAAKNFLSLKDVDIALGDLNVLVGPNGSGKTNFLNIFRFIGDVARTDLIPAIESFGGFAELLFRREESDNKPEHLKLHLEGVMTKHAHPDAVDKYTLDITQLIIKLRSSPAAMDPFPIAFRRHEEVVLKRTAGKGRRITLSGGAIEFVPLDKSSRSSAGKAAPKLEVQEMSSGLAILRRLGKNYDAPQIEEIAQIFEQLRLFEVNVAAARRPVSAVAANRLNADASNIAAFLIYLKESHPEHFSLIKEDVAYVLPGFRDFQFHKIGGSDEAVRLDIVEAPLAGATPLARASFGTIRSIALFAMLHDPNPPRLTCLEEVDHGLHPHALDRLVERLRDASKQTQIIVATHSPALVNRLAPEELIVFQRDPETGATVQPKISPAQMRAMEQASGYRLGELWFSGAIGGNP
jgi:predicted ATPase